jgi:peptidoglycan/xylan/chitin deacetylase (PgdA/CDA1 family)
VGGLRHLALGVTLAGALLAGCVQAPPREPVAVPPAVALPPSAEEPVIARDGEFAVVTAQSGESLATLAERWLGDRSQRTAIAEFNGIDEVRSGQVVAIPLRKKSPLGVTATGVQALTILCYHRFGTRANPLTVTPAAFEAQMSYLARNGYQVVPLARVAAFLEGRESLPPKSVVITIDDGYRSMYDIAFPILRRHRFPSTVFLYSDFVGAPDALTWPQMREMVASGLVEIQPHSKTHANLTVRLPDEPEARYRDRARREVEAPVEVLRAQLGVSTHAFAFPYGDVNETVMGELRARNLKLGVTVTPGGNAFYAPPYMLRRTMIFGGDDLDAFRAKLVTTLPLARN